MCRPGNGLVDLHNVVFHTHATQGQKTYLQKSEGSSQASLLSNSTYSVSDRSGHPFSNAGITAAPKYIRAPDESSFHGSVNTSSGDAIRTALKLLDGFGQAKALPKVQINDEVAPPRQFLSQVQPTAKVSSNRMFDTAASSLPIFSAAPIDVSLSTPHSLTG